MMLFMPESPYFLMSKYNDEKAARRSLDWIYNGNEADIEKVMEDIRLYQTVVARPEIFPVEVKKSKPGTGTGTEKVKIEKPEKSELLQKKIRKYFSGEISYLDFFCYNSSPCSGFGGIRTPDSRYQLWLYWSVLSAQGCCLAHKFLAQA